MKIKRYEGQYVHEVIAEIRSELGPDAVVLHTRWRNPAGLKKLLGRPQVEIWAAEGDAPQPEAEPQPAPEPVAEANGRVTGPLAARALALKQALAETPAAPAEAEPFRFGDGLAPRGRPARREPDPAPVPSDDLQAAILRLEGKVDTLQRRAETGTLSAGGNRLQALLEVGVDAEVAAEIVRAADEQTVAEVLLDSFQVTGDWQLDRPRVVALVGPSGAGKTSLTAKLAARHGVRGGRRVLIVAADSQRVGSLEQLQALGELMELPVVPARSAAEAASRLRGARQNYDLVLIDTAAWSHRDPGSWERLVDLLTTAKPDEVYAVLPAGIRGGDARRWIARLRGALPLAGVILTKLDETATPGVLVDLSWRERLPFAYLSNGPEVPGDLECATCDALIELAWSSRLNSQPQESFHGLAAG